MTHGSSSRPIWAMIVVALASQTAGQASSVSGAHSKLFSTEDTVPQHLASIDSGTGSTSVLGLTGNFFIGIDYRASNHTLYGAGSRLASLDLATGAATTLGLTPELMASIAFSPSDQLFAVSNSGNTLYKLDPATGSMLSSVSITGTVHATDGSPALGEINGIDFGPDGTLFGIGFGLYTINPHTGVATRLTPIGSYVSATRDLFKDLDFGMDGVLRGVNYSNKSSIYTIDRSTGLGMVEATSVYQAAGIASVPEPSSLVLAAMGLCATAAVVRRAQCHGIAVWLPNARLRVRISATQKGVDCCAATGHEIAISQLFINVGVRAATPAGQLRRRRRQIVGKSTPAEDGPHNAFLWQDGASATSAHTAFRWTQATGVGAHPPRSAQ